MVIENQAVAKQNAMVMVPIINYVEVIPTPPRPDNNVNAGTLRLGGLKIDLEKINNK